MWNICGYQIEEGTKKQIVLKVDDTCEIPAAAVCGAEPGRNLLVIAGTHSCEFPSVPAVIRTARLIDPALVHGNVLFIHCLNTSGFRERSDAVVPEDHGNLNACMPGRKDGSVTQKIAYYLEQEILPGMDFIADLHSGGLFEELRPCLFWPDAENTRKQELEAAKAMNIPVLIRSENKAGIIGYGAYTLGIPGLLMERGGNGLCREEWILAYMKDLRLLMKHLEIYDCDLETETYHVIFDQAYYPVSDREGLWYPRISAGQTVHEGELLGTVEDIYGNVLNEYRAVCDGQVFYCCTGLSVDKGTALAAYGDKRSRR